MGLARDGQGDDRSAGGQGGLRDGRIARLDKEIRRRVGEEDVPSRLMAIPGMGPITAPPPEIFRKGRDFSAWVGLTPLQRPTGGKQKLGAISRVGGRALGRLLLVGAGAGVHHASRRHLSEGSGLAQRLARKPRMPVIVALPTRWPGSPGRRWPGTRSAELPPWPREVVAGRLPGM